MPESELFSRLINVPARMRDGAILRADIYRPDAEYPCPTILARTPYGKSRGGGYMDPPRFARAGYAVVIQDCRGIGDSDGEYYPWRSDAADGYDTIEWIAAQPWCDGNVGMYGASNLGSTQWVAAALQPPHLKAISPAVTAPFLPFVRNGVVELGACLEWYLMQSTSSVKRASLQPEQKKRDLDELARLMSNLSELWHFLPLRDVPPTGLLKELGLAPYISDWVTNIDTPAYWEALGSPVPLEKVAIPALHTTDWYHPLANQVLASYQLMTQRGGSDLARKNQKLLLGPWSGTELLGGVPVTGEDTTGLHLKWFDYWLRGISNGIMEEPRVRIFVMGDNVWRDENEWPLARTVYTRYFMHSGGRANSRFGDGTLSSEAPGDETADHYTYDPHDPAPTKAQLMMGPKSVPVQDQREVEERQDVLVYTTPPLAQDVEVTGPVVMNLWASSSAVDTDFTGKLVDVWPNGKAYNLTDGILRARYRESVFQPKLLEPDRVYEFCIELGATGNAFKAGHRIRLEVSSSNFPLHNRNLNTGHPIGEDTEIRTAGQTIFHNRQYPSHLLLPIIPRK